MDFLLGTGYGQFTACMVSWAILVLAGAVAWVRSSFRETGSIQLQILFVKLYFTNERSISAISLSLTYSLTHYFSIFLSKHTHIQWFAGGSESLDLGLENDDFADSIWASYIMFIDIGTQTAMATTDESLTLLIAVLISITGFVFLLLVLGVIVDLVRKVLDFYESRHSRIITNGHTVILGWSDKVLSLLDEMAQMIVSTIGSNNLPIIVILCDEDVVDIIQQIKITYGSMNGSESA